MQLSIPMAAGILVRGRDTRSQVGLGHQERWDNVWDAFECQDNRVRDSRVLVIDDVYTTGATLEACGWTLLDAGAASVSALTLTYAVRGSGVDLKRRV